MKRVSITAARNTFGALIDLVKAGSSVLILDGGRPVARLAPVAPDTRDCDDNRIERLVREGVVRPARASMPNGLLTSEPPAAAKGALIVEALLQERLAGR